MEEVPHDRIRLYAREYVRQFNTLTPQLAALPVPASLYAFPIISTTICQAPDGFVILYQSEQTVTSDSDTRLVALSDIPLATLLQALTFNLVKVFLPPSEQITTDPSSLEHLLRLPPDMSIEAVVEIMNRTKFPPLNRRLMELGVLEQGSINVTAMGITPMAQFREGYFVGIQPTRQHIYAPVLSHSDDRVLFQFEWQFADVMWEPDRLTLDIDSAQNNADLDTHFLRLGSRAGLSTKEISENPHELIARELLHVCDEFELLIDNPDTAETDVQTYLEEPAHLFLLAPVHREVYPRKQLGGKYITDFTVLKSDGDYHFIEIEDPHRRIFQSSGQEQSAHLTHAITQVQDWLRYVDDNRDMVRREDDLSTIYRPTGEVVAGRTAHLGDTALRRFRFSQAGTERITIRTYDMILQEARAYAESLRARGNL